jgi:serine phosphatase RsbU (regulator of sigma subunit)/Tfp pilus assembly protein PilF
MKKPIIYLLLFILTFFKSSFAQNFNPEQQKQIDSLNAIISNPTSHDTSLAGAYVGLSKLLAVSNLDTVIFLCTKAKNIAEKGLATNPSKTITLSLSKSLANALNNIGFIHYNQGNIPLTLKYFHKSLKIQETINNNKGMAYAYNNIGMIYKNQGDIPLALEYLHKSLKIQEAINNKKGMAQSYINIGSVHNNQGDIPLALEYYHKSLKIQEAINDIEGMASSYNNIGLIHNNQGDIPLALKFHHKSLEIQEAIGKKNGIAASYNNIGTIHEKQGNIPLALEYYLKSLKIQEAISDKRGMAMSYNNIGNLILENGKSLDWKTGTYLAEAKENGEQGLKIAQEIGFPEVIELNASLLSRVAVQQGNYREALEMRNLEILMRDSIVSEKAKKAGVKTQLKYEYEKKALADSVANAKEIEIKNIELSKQQAEIKAKRNQQYALFGGLFLVVVFAGFMYNRFKVTQKQKVIIEQKERETNAQKEIIEEKHKEITDSINYAERIQRSFLATREMLDENLRDYFVFFKPKDVVSGDFYWAAELNNGNFAFTVADSTGHGVPGAIMSILNISSLEKSIEVHTEPQAILAETRKIIINRLKKDGSPEGGKDGMDCSLLVLNHDKTQLSFASAHNPVIIIRNQELLEFRGDKMPVGKHDKDNDPFTLHAVALEQGDTIYTLTDGFPDQFGGPKGKKFMIKSLKELFLQMAHLPMQQQKQKLAEEFDKWKGANEQVDDVCVIGVRV